MQLGALAFGIIAWLAWLSLVVIGDLTRSIALGIGFWCTGVHAVFQMLVYSIMIKRREDALFYFGGDYGFSHTFVLASWVLDVFMNKLSDPCSKDSALYPTAKSEKMILRIAFQADEFDDASAEARKKRSFRKFSYRGVDLEQLLDLTSEQLMELVHARARRRFQRGLKRKPMGLIKKLRKAKKEAQPNEKPATVKTHLRNMIIVPEMIGSVVGVYNGKTFNQVEIKPEMTGHYLGEFSITYKPVKHGRPGIGATHSSRFIPLK
eukprot:jgi/Hompol1/988/HPOL_002627-RA